MRILESFDYPVSLKDNFSLPEPHIPEGFEIVDMITTPQQIIVHQEEVEVESVLFVDRNYKGHVKHKITQHGAHYRVDRTLLLRNITHGAKKEKAN